MTAFRQIAIRPPEGCGRQSHRSNYRLAQVATVRNNVLNVRVDRSRGFRMPGASGGDVDALINAIRQARKFRSQKQVAARAGLSPGHLSLLVNGKRDLTRDTYEKLAAAFPEFQDRLAKVLATHEARATDPSAVELHRIETLIDRGRKPEASGALTRLIARPSLPPSVAALAHGHLASIEFDARNVDAGTANFLKAIDAARRSADGVREEAYLERLALRLTQAECYEEAERFVVAAVARNFYNTTLWRRLGVVRWYANALLDAYAALSVALLLGHPRNHIVHARGQVLAELGQHEAAIVELTEAIDIARTPLSKAYARSSRAWAHAQGGDKDLALEEFAEAERETPDNGWLHFFRARCYDLGSDSELALSSFNVALQSSAPPLTRAKREFALARVAALTQAQ
jgi:tetratricopeptide (TPR) repeat protein